MSLKQREWWGKHETPTERLPAMVGKIRASDNPFTKQAILSQPTWLTLAQINAQYT